MTLPTLPQDLLGPPITQGYEPSIVPSMFLQTRHRPPFSSIIINEMLTDPRVLYGLFILKGPLSADAKVSVICDDPTVEKYLKDFLNRFWATAVMDTLSAIEWGFSVSECLYEQDPTTGIVSFQKTAFIHPLDCHLVVDHGQVCGVNLRHRNDPKNTGHVTYIGMPKIFVHVHDRKFNRYYGKSRLFNAFIPWWEMWSEGGYRDIRRLWYYKNSFEGGTMRFPLGNTRLPDGRIIDNRELARDIVTKRRTGGVLTLPSTVQGDSNSPAWDYQPPTSPGAPDGLLDYGELLRGEIFEGLGIPLEIVQSSGNQGFGSSTGRQVPMDAFYCVLQDLLQAIVNDLKVLATFLVKMNFGPVPFDMIPEKLKDQSSPENNGNQFQDENQNPKSKEEVEAASKDSEESVDDHDSKVSGFLKSRSKRQPFQMADAPTTPAGSHWVTIGGSAKDGKEHVGGFKVCLDGDGKIIKGGPSALRGTHVSDSKNALNKLYSPKHTPDVPDDHPEERRSHGLPHPTSKMAEVLRRLVGPDAEHQSGFMDILKEVHAEHKADIASRKQTAGDATVADSKAKSTTKRKANSDQYDHYLGKSGFTDSRLDPEEMKKAIQEGVDSGTLKTNQDVQRALASSAKDHDKKLKSGKNLKDADGNDTQLPHDTLRQWLKGKYAKSGGGTRTSVESKIRETAASTGINEKDLKLAADDLWTAKYSDMERRNRILSDIAQAHGLDKKRLHGEKGAEDAASIEGLDKAAQSISFEYPELGIDRDDTNAADKLFQLIQKGPEKLPLKSSDEFMQEVLQYMGADEDDQFTEKPIDHPDILNAALNRVNQGIYQDF